MSTSLSRTGDGHYMARLGPIQAVLSGPQGEAIGVDWLDPRHLPDEIPITHPSLVRIREYQLAVNRREKEERKLRR